MGRDDRPADEARPRQARAHKQKRRVVDTSLREFLHFFEDEEGFEDYFDLLDLDVDEAIPRRDRP